MSPLRAEDPRVTLAVRLVLETLVVAGHGTNLELEEIVFAAAEGGSASSSGLRHSRLLYTGTHALLELQLRVTQPMESQGGKASRKAQTSPSGSELYQALLLQNSGEETAMRVLRVELVSSLQPAWMPPECGPASKPSIETATSGKQPDNAEPFDSGDLHAPSRVLKATEASQCEMFNFTIEATDADDVEEEMASGRVYIDSSDLELGSDEYVGGCQAVGIRFPNVSLPANAELESVALLLTADVDGPTETFVLDLDFAALADCPRFNGSDFEVTGLATFGQPVAWASDSWRQGTVHPSADLSGVLQNVIAQDGWQEGNAVCVVIKAQDGCTWYEEGKDLHYEAESANNPESD
eukprot:gene31439-39541_t